MTFTEDDGTPWPKLYSTTIIDRAVMTLPELEALWEEYREFWRGREGHSNRTEQSDYQKDWTEERDGTYR